MKNTKRILTGVLFAATLAVSLMANGGDAYAKVKSSGGQTHNSSGGGITITVPTPAAEVFETLGITWE
jgi:hypothetical protein